MTELSNELDQVQLGGFLDSPEEFPEFRRYLSERLTTHPKGKSLMERAGITTIGSQETSVESVSVQSKQKSPKKG